MPLLGGAGTSRNPIGRIGVLGALALLLLPGPAVFAAPPLVPGAMTYQGVLLDGTGAPRTGNVALTLRIYPSLSGGPVVYTQTFPSVPLTDGVFTVALGPAGDATDTPDDPLTTSLVDALTADLGGLASARFLEVTVGATGPLLRTQILTTPYALRADSAAAADVATSALSADVALNAQGIGGLSSDVVTEIFEHTNLDGEGPGNADASEGLGDTDFDGIANFVDPDNDNDGLSDGAEVAQGSDINLVTPSIAAFAPATADGFVPNSIQIQGSGFDPGLTVAFGPETPPPANLTFTSFEIDVGPQPEGTVSVVLTNPNGQSATQPYDFFFFVPSVSLLSPAVGTSADTTQVKIVGQNLSQVQSVAFGTESPTPFNVANTAFDVVVGPQTPGFVDVTVALGNGNETTVQNGFEFRTGLVHAVSFVANLTQLTFDVLPGTDTVLLGGDDEYGIDTDDNGIPELIVPLESKGELAVAFTPSGAIAGVRCRTLGANSCDVEYLVDSDADLDLEDETPTVIENLIGAALLLTPTIAFDPSGRPVMGYSAKALGNEAVVAHDRDGNGDFAGLNERVAIQSVGSNAHRRSAEVAVDSSGNVATLFYSNNGFAVRLAYDRNGDGDYDDTVGGNPELFDLATGVGVPPCVGLTFDAADHLAGVFGEVGGAATLVRDTNGDGDFDDVGETAALPGDGAEGCDVASDPSGFFAVALGRSGAIDLLIDRNDDHDFDDANETGSIADLLAIDQVELHVESSTNPAFIGTTSKIHKFVY